MSSKSYTSILQHTHQWKWKFAPVAHRQMKGTVKDIEVNESEGDK